MEYTVIQSPDLANFVTQVNEHLADGWELHGPSMHTVAGYSQAMTTTKKAEKKATKPLEGKEESAKVGAK